MRPLPPLRTLYEPVHSFGWTDLLVIPLFVRIFRSHRRWGAFVLDRANELSGRSASEHSSVWSKYPNLMDYERRLSPLIAKGFSLPSDLLHPEDCCDALFVSQNDIDDLYGVIMKIEKSERIEVPDSFGNEFPDQRSYHALLSYIGGLKHQP